MSAQWHNVYVCDTSSGHPTPKDAEFYGCQDPRFDFVRLEQRWNGRPVRPPVGIKAEQCSHLWHGNSLITREANDAYHGDIDGDLECWW